MRAIWFILKLPLKILMAPVILSLTLFVWICVDGLLSRTPDELFEVLLSDYRSYEELRLTKGCREVTEEDERQAEILCQSFRERWKEEEK